MNTYVIRLIPNVPIVTKKYDKPIASGLNSQFG